MSAQATKRPWKVIKHSPAIADVLDGNGLIVARCGKNQAEQDAALIVAAVNSHDALLAQNRAMREALELAQDFLIGAHLPRNDGGFIHNKINAALTRGLLMACVKCSQGDHADHVDVYQGTACIGCGCTSVKKGGGMHRNGKTNIGAELITDYMEQVTNLKADRAALIEALREWMRLVNLYEIAPHHSSDGKDFDAVVEQTDKALAQVEGKGK